VRPRPRETIVFVLWGLVVVYTVAALISTAVGTRCLVDPSGQSCNGWINHWQGRDKGALGCASVQE
jgi:hypothetical protein